MPPAFAPALPLSARAPCAPCAPRAPPRAPRAPRRAPPARAAVAAAGPPAGDTTAAPGGEGAHRLSAGVRARTVVSVGRSATLCTLSEKHDGVPFGSFCDYVLDEVGRPVLLLGGSSEHTKNIVGRADGERVSLYCSGAGGQAGCRVTLVGRIAKMGEGEDLEEVREDYFHAHAYAKEALEYPDLFSFYRMEVEGVYFVGGFGVVAQWVDAAEYSRAEPDPIAADAGRIVDQINATRSDELRTLCEVFLGVADAQKATMMGLDRLGFDLRVRGADTKIREYRIAFREEVANTFDCQSALVKAFQEAWEMQNGLADSWASEHARPAIMYYSLA